MTYINTYRHIYAYIQKVTQDRYTYIRRHQ